MKEKEKCTMKAEDSSYGPVADSRCPFSEDAEIHRLQNAFGEALGDMPLPEETRKEWSIFVQRQEQKKRKLHLRIWLSGGVAAMLALPYCSGRPGRKRITDSLSKSLVPSMHRSRLQPRKKTAHHHLYPTSYNDQSHFGGRKQSTAKRKQSSGIPERICFQKETYRKSYRRSTFRSY